MPASGRTGTTVVAQIIIDNSFFTSKTIGELCFQSQCRDWTNSNTGTTAGTLIEDSYRHNLFAQGIFVLLGRALINFLIFFFTPLTINGVARPRSKRRFFIISVRFLGGI